MRKNKIYIPILIAYWLLVILPWRFIAHEPLVLGWIPTWLFIFYVLYLTLFVLWVFYIHVWDDGRL